MGVPVEKTSRSSMRAGIYTCGSFGQVTPPRTMVALPPKFSPNSHK